MASYRRKTVSWAAYGVVRFDNDQELRETAGGLLASESPPEDVETPDVAQNMLENSNVQPIMEIARMIAVERA